jgi:hypothetical protein
MTRWILLVLLLVGLSAAGTVFVQWWELRGDAEPEKPRMRAVSGDKPRPRAVVDGDLTYEFGTLPQRTTSKHTWIVHNTGNADLELSMLSSTCSCTLAKFKDGKTAVVHPGESSPIDLEFETRENNGEYVKGAEIGTNDPELEAFSLRVKGLVFPAVVTYPPEPVVNFGKISNENEENVQRFAVFSMDRPETKVLEVKSENPNVGAEVIDLKPEEIKLLPPQYQGIVKRGMMVHMKVKSGMPLGLFREEAVIKTDHPKQSELRMTLTGQMTGPINAMPGGVSMHEVYGKTGGRGEIRVVVASKRATKFEVVKKPGRLKVEVVPSDADNLPGTYRLIVTVPPGSPPERIEDEIVLKTDHPKAATVIIPVSIWVLNSL